MNLKFWFVAFVLVYCESITDKSIHSRIHHCFRDGWSTFISDAPIVLRRNSVVSGASEKVLFEQSRWECMLWNWRSSFWSLEAHFCFPKRNTVWLAMQIPSLTHAIVFALLANVVSRSLSILYDFQIKWSFRILIHMYSWCCVSIVWCLFSTVTPPAMSIGGLYSAF